MYTLGLQLSDQAKAKAAQANAQKKQLKKKKLEKKQMLKKVRHAGTTNLLIFGTYVIQNSDGYNRRAVVFMQDHMQTIFQIVF
jgi:hypothetical protein